MTGGQTAFNVQSTPQVVRTTSMLNGRCVLTSPAELAVGSTALPIRTEPTGASVQWDPGMNSKTCRVAYGTADARLASALVDDINAAPPSKGNLACPNDDGSAVRLIFSYADGTAFGPVIISLSGCRVVKASGYATRDSTEKIQSSLATIAPRAWRSSLDGR
jgi:hypothetical protein